MLSKAKPVNSCVYHITTLCKLGRLKEALYILQFTDNSINSCTYVSLLQCCIRKKALGQGKLIHAHITQKGFIAANTLLQNTLANMYAKCESVVDARRVFDEISERNVCSWTVMISAYTLHGHVDEARKLFESTPHRDVRSWTVMISAYAKHGPAKEAFTLLHQMQRAGLPPNHFTFVAILSACAHLASLKQGMEIHGQIIRSGLQSDVFVANALLDMYAKCGRLETARYVFDKMSERDVVSWTEIILGYAQKGVLNEALRLFQEMPERDVWSWTAMIAAYTKFGFAEEALTLFFQMQGAGIQPNQFTFSSVLPACANLADLEQGMHIHEEIKRCGFQSNVFVANALVDMYAKCGRVETARDVFDRISEPDVVSWTAIIAGYAMHGSAKEALKFFEDMKHSGISPNHVTLVSVLSACCHAGLVEEGYQYFNCMSTHYRITPVMEHYSCMVDLLGRAGHLDEAKDFINKMPIKADASVWSCLLSACRIYSNIELGEYAAEQLFELNPENDYAYVLLSNIYAAASRWEDIEKIRKRMNGRGVKRNPGCSWIQVDKKMHAFIIGDRSHPHT
jgi:pentatricopeptide repeat protein